MGGNQKHYYLSISGKHFVTAPIADTAAGKRLKCALAEQHREVLRQKEFAFATIQRKIRFWSFRCDCFPHQAKQPCEERSAVQAPVSKVAAC